MCADTPDATPDYKATLNLPETDFPMRAGLPKREPGWLERWARIGVYDRLRATADGRPPYILHDGPPYANGHLHIGHALNKILKDFVVRSHQMLGFDARYVPGWDCHGLPIEWKIEEQYRAKGQDKDAVDVIDFRQECRRFAVGWVDIQREEFKRLGVTGKWDDPYLTMDYHAEAVIADEFMKFLMNGTLYQGSKPVMWSPVEKTALAEAEVEYHDKKSDAIWVKFPVVELNKDIYQEKVLEAGTYMRGAPIKDYARNTVHIDPGQTQDLIEKANNPPTDLAGAQVIIWTTTPWTIPQNRAVCYGPTIAYGLYEVTGRPEESWARIGDRYLIAEELVDDVLKSARLGPEMVTKLRDVAPAELESLTLAHPFRGLADNGEWDFDVPMLPGDHVTAEAGTGFVHTAPSHGDDDYQIGLKYKLPMTHNVLEDGSFRLDLPFFGGRKILRDKPKKGDWEGDANKAVIDKLVECGALIARGRITHSYPHSWRSKAPVIYRNTPQWFVAIDTPCGGDDTYGKTIRERALTSIDKLVKWTPPSGRNRLYAMIEARPDWVLSRQRAWGVPLTCFVRKGARPDDADFLLKNDAVNARIKQAFDAEGADCWYAEGARERFLTGIVDPDDYEQVFDVLDVWFDSGSTHAFVLRDRPDGAPDGIADLYLEGTDQHRGWFHSSMLEACGTIGRAPYRGVMTCGFTLDDKGMKMSKSLGNIIAPEKIIKQYGADILRLWVAQVDYTADQRIGDEILKGVADSYRRLRNTMRFILGSLGDFSAKNHLPPAHMPELERWVLHRLAQLDHQVREGYRNLDFQAVWQAVFTFATVDLSSFYFDIRKDALYCGGEGDPARLAALTVLDLLHERLTTWLAPILAFTMEEVWLERHPGADSSVHLMDFPATPADWLDEPLAAKWESIRRARRVVTAALEVERRDKVIGASLEAAPVVHVRDPELLDALKSVDFADICITSGITLTADPIPAEAFRLPEVEGVGVVFEKAQGQKCQRCWKILPDVGTHGHPGVCGRCDAALG